MAKYKGLDEGVIIYTIILLISVGVRKLQVAILARSSREMSQTVRIDWQYILSRVRVSVRPSNFFIREKHPKPRGNRVASACVYLNDPATDHEGQRNRRKGALTLSRFGATDASNLNGDSGVCVLVRACMRVWACVRECVRAWCVCNIR